MTGSEVTTTVLLTLDVDNMLARAMTYCPMSLSSMSRRSMSLALSAKGEEHAGGGNRCGAGLEEGAEEEEGAGARRRLLGESNEGVALLL